MAQNINDLITRPFVKTPQPKGIYLEVENFQTITEKDYEKLLNLPTLEGVEIKGDMTFADFGITHIMQLDTVAQIPTFGDENMWYFVVENNTFYR